MSDSKPFLDIIKRRHCQRAFLDEPVPRTELELILIAAANAPSGKNTQPWLVEIVEGETLADLSQRLLSLIHI